MYENITHNSMQATGWTLKMGSDISLNRLKFFIGVIVIRYLAEQVDNIIIVVIVIILSDVISALL